MNSTSRSRRTIGFTLIELLVVISIIAVLAGLAFPALQGALDTARKAQAATMCNQLATACTMYNTEYGVWPAPSGQTSDYEVTSPSSWNTMCIALNGNKNISDGSTVSGNGIANTRYIQFMSFNKKDLYSQTDGAIRTPCIRAGVATDSRRLYQMKLDCDYSGTLTSMPDISKASGTTTLPQGVAVWCYTTSSSATVDNTKLVASYR